MDNFVVCNQCGKEHRRYAVDDWVYHVSMGVRCRNHPGVMEQYNKLLEKANKQMEEQWKSTT